MLRLTPLRCVVPGLFLLAACGAESAPSEAVETTAAVWDIGEEPVLTLGADEAAPREALFAEVMDGALLPGSGLAVLEGGTYEIRGFDATGSPLWITGGRGDGPSEIQMAMNLRRELDGSLSVPDRLATAVKYFDSTGDHLRSDPVEGGPREGGFLGPFHAPIASGAVPLVDREQLPPDEAWFTARMTRSRIVLVSPDATFEAPWLETGVYFTIRDGDLLHFGMIPFTGKFILASGASFTVAGGGRGTIQLLDGHGVYELDSPHAAQPATPALLEAHLATLHDPENVLWALEETEHPASTPTFDALAVDGLDRIWVRRFTLSGPARWAAIDREGTVLGMLELPEDAEVLDADESRLLVRRVSELDVEYIEVWRLPGGER